MTRRLASALVCSGTEKGGLAVGYARSEKSPDAVMKADAMSIIDSSLNYMRIEHYLLH